MFAINRISRRTKGMSVDLADKGFGYFGKLEKDDYFKIIHQNSNSLTADRDKIDCKTIRAIKLKNIEKALKADRNTMCDIKYNPRKIYV